MRRQKLVLERVDLVSTWVTLLLLEQVSGFAMMSRKWLHICLLLEQRLRDLWGDSRWAMALLLGLLVLSLLFCIGLCLILRWRVSLRAFGMRRPICTEKYSLYSHFAVTYSFFSPLSLSFIMQQFVCTFCFHYILLKVFSLELPLWF